MKELSTKTSIIILAVIIILIAVLYFTGAFSGSNVISPAAAQTKIEKFINENLMAPGSTAKIEAITETNGLYKLSINVGKDKNVDAYVSKDVSLFFPSAIEMKETKTASNDNATATNNTTAAAVNAIPTSTKPLVELFVMSYCPYGTQIEKGIIPVVEKLGSKIDFKLKFVDYSMHGEKELRENMTQYCIQKEQTSKLLPYLKCFLETEDSTGCLTKTGVDGTKLATCVSATDKQFNVLTQTEKRGQFPVFNIFEADNEKYDIQGSPTLIINGKESQSNRDSASLLSAICAVFSTKPAECNAKLSSTNPAPGFGSGASNISGGGCGN